MHIARTFEHTLFTTLLITGTNLGIAALSFPFAPHPENAAIALFIYIFSWLFLLSIGLLMLEICIWMPKDAHLITFTEYFLGRWGRIGCGILYLFFFIHLLSILLIATLLAYLFSAHTSLFHYSRNFEKVAWTLPFSLMALSYQTLVPTIYKRMNRNIKKVRRALFLGTVISFIFYTPLFFLKASVSSLSFFGLLAALVAISRASVDFLSDSLNSTKKKRYKGAACFFIFALAFLIAWINPFSLIHILTHSPVYLIALLLNVIAIFMIWIGRYRKGYSPLHQQLPGGKISLSLLIAFLFFDLIKFIV